MRAAVQPASALLNEHVEFRLLGPLEVHDGENVLQLGGPKQRTLLALLLLRAGEVVSVDALTDVLWGDEPPRTSSTAIHNFVADLRKQLGAERLVTRAPGYLLDLEDDELDVHGASTRRGREGGAARRARRPASARRGPLARPALRRIHLRASSRQTAIARLEELRLAVVEDRIGAEVELGQHADAVAELEGLVPSIRCASAYASN